jgi:hypothetical protein
MLLGEGRVSEWEAEWEEMVAELQERRSFEVAVMYVVFQGEEAE